MKRTLKNIWHSFPVQLFLLHLRSNLLLLFIWLFVFALATGSILRKFGMKFLFLSPEYLGKVNFLSYLFLGVAFGAFFMTWNLTTYLLYSMRFSFLASMARPFRKFVINNSILPLFFLVIYIINALRCQSYYIFLEPLEITFNMLAFLGGFLGFVLISILYFYFTNKDIDSYLISKGAPPPNLVRALAPGKRGMHMTSQVIEDMGSRVSFYLNERLGLRRVRSVAHYDPKVLFRVFKQNHTNALVVQVASILVLIIMGLMIENKYFRIPTGASIFLLMSIVVALLGAINYYFGNWSATGFIMFLLVINFISGLPAFNTLDSRSKGYGLSYASHAKYTEENLREIFSQKNFEEDIKSTEGILNSWKEKVQKNSPEKPKLIVTTVSGGGLKSAVWAMQVLQRSDSLLNGEILDHTVLSAGASGGMIGIAYLRELMLRKNRGESINIYDKGYRENISRDLLNPVAFTIISNDLFLPWARFKLDGNTYKKDRGYMFEYQMVENTGGILNKRLGEYELPERNAEIPLLFITPSIVNDGRRLIISSQQVSYMMSSPVFSDGQSNLQIDAVDFRRLFEKQEADKLKFSSALRMNATYPYVLPAVFLPSYPAIEVMDAGFRDNDGTKSAVRFLQVFKDWIEENTSGIVLLQIRGALPTAEVKDFEYQGIIESILNPLGIAGKILQLQNFDHDTDIGMLYDIYDEHFIDIVRFTYSANQLNERASMSFHLTQRERQDIQDAYFLPENQESFRKLKELIGE